MKSSKLDLFLKEDLDTLIYLGVQSKHIKQQIFNNSKSEVNISEVHNIIQNTLDVHNKLYPFNKLSLAFPTNVNMSKNLAHNIITEGFLKQGIIKVDFGLKLNKCIIDTAISITFTQKYIKLLDVLNQLFIELQSFLKPNQKVFEISSFIFNYITKHDLVVISELSGHTITKQDLHAKPYIYNTLINDNSSLYENQVFTIEPFITDTKNYKLYETKAKIFKTRDSEFTTIFSSKVIEKYNVLSLDVESAQVQHTYLVQKDKVLRLT